jgi:4-amino-4-deoxy-L-arabinose transferase-like glycosyltransferase
MVVSLVSGDGWPAPGDRHVSQGVARSSGFYYGQQLKTRPLDKGLTDVPPRGQRPSLGQLGGDASAGGLPNQIVQHPPLYYAGEALVVKLLGAQDWPYDKLVGLLRILTALLCAPLPVLVWGIANRLRAGPPAAVCAAVLSVGVPGLSRVAGLVNNDGMLIISTTALLLGLTYVATGDLTRRTGIVVGLLTGLALLSKGFALTFPLLVVLAYLMGMRRDRVRALVPLAWALGVGFVTGGLWWVRNLLLFGAIQPSGFGDQLSKVTGAKVVPRGYIDTAGFWNVVQDRLTRTFWGGVGIANRPTLTKDTGTALCIAVGVLIVLGVALGMRERRNRGPLLLLLLPAPLVFGLLVNNSWRDFVSYKQTTGLQGRYLYCGIAGLAVAVAIALDRALGRWRGALPVLTAALVVWFQYTHSVRLINGLWLGPGRTGGLRQAVKGMEVITPWGAGLVGTVLVLTVLSALGVLGLAAHGMFARVTAPEAEPQQTSHSES